MFHRPTRRGVVPSGPFAPGAVLILLVDAVVDGVVLGEAPPELDSRIAPGRIEQQQDSLEADGLIAPDAIGNQEHTRIVGRGAAFREQDRLARIVRTTSYRAWIADGSTVRNR